MTEQRPILVATRNPAKLEQVRRLLTGLPWRPEPPPVDVDVQVDESGETFQENAERKASAWAKATGRLVIATDGGLEIPALGAQWQALKTRRATGPVEANSEETDQARIDRLLELVADRTGEDRRVRWTEAVAVATPERMVGSWQASGAEAVLADSPAPLRGPSGFWVDRLRFYPALGKYHSELSDAERAAIGDPWATLRARLAAELRA